MAIKPDFDIIL